MKIYTKIGDGGETRLSDGRRISKADARVEAYGAVDELGAWLGLAATMPDPERDPRVAELLTDVQRDLFALGALLADPSGDVARRETKVVIDEPAVQRLERWIDELEEELPPLRTFILAGGSRLGATLHVARTVCRRAERRVSALGAGAVEPTAMAYVNRLSDLLFVLARAVNHRQGLTETAW